MTPAPLIESTVSSDRTEGSTHFSMELTRNEESNLTNNQLLRIEEPSFSVEPPDTTSSILFGTLVNRLRRGPDARAQFVESHLAKGMAYQIRAIREERGLSQEALAEKVGMNQNAISRLESSKYGKPTITTLKRLARAFDVALAVRFVPFSHFTRWVAGVPYVENGLSSESLNVPSFGQEEEEHVFDRLLYERAAQRRPRPKRITIIQRTLSKATQQYLDDEKQKEDPQRKLDAENLMKNAAGSGREYGISSGLAS